MSAGDLTRSHRCSLITEDSPSVIAIDRVANELCAGDTFDLQDAATDALSVIRYLPPSEARLLLMSAGGLTVRDMHAQLTKTDGRLTLRAVESRLRRARAISAAIGRFLGMK